MELRVPMMIQGFVVLKRLPLKALTTADGTLKHSLSYFSEKIRLDISCELST